MLAYKLEAEGGGVAQAEAGVEALLLIADYGAVEQIRFEPCAVRAIHRGRARKFDNQDGFKERLNALLFRRADSYRRPRPPHAQAEPPVLSE